MTRRLVLGLGLATGVALAAVGCDTKSSAPLAAPPGGKRPDETRQRPGGEPGDAAKDAAKDAKDAAKDAKDSAKDAKDAAKDAKDAAKDAGKKDEKKDEKK